jgi:hypothetical protein
MAELRASRNIIVGYWTKVVDEFSRMRVGLRKLAKAHRLLRDLLQQRVAELEAENERLRAALMPLETSSMWCRRQRRPLCSGTSCRLPWSWSAGRWASWPNT